MLTFILSPLGSRVNVNREEKVQVTPLRHIISTYLQAQVRVAFDL